MEILEKTLQVTHEWALDNGTPTYYNSNILGRYYRKDYFKYDETNSSIDSTDTN